jgi:hypothetical protein
VLGKPPATLMRDQLVARARLVADALHHGRPDVVRAYGSLWPLAPDGFDHVVELAGGPYDDTRSRAVTTTIWQAANTEVGDRAALSLLDRIIALDVDVRQWLGACERNGLASWSGPVSRRLVDALLRFEMPRAAVDVLFANAIETLDVAWWRELVAVVGDRPDRLGGHPYRSPDEWDEVATVVILAELADIGGYVCAKLAVQLVQIGGAQTKWSQAWRERLDELRAHEDVDIRELATAIRYPS